MAYFTNWRITRTSILFVLGIVVLAAVVFGGIWIVKERGEQARRDEAVKIAEQNLEEQSKVAIDKATQAVNKNTSDNSETSTTGSNTSTTSTTTSSNPSTTELPATGTEFTNVIVVTMLSLAVALYVTSRKAVRES